MDFIKNTLKNTASLFIAVWIIGSAYAAISTVSSGDPLTADSWNSIVNKLNNTDTNSTDLVTKSYVDSAISANSGGYPITNDISQKSWPLNGSSNVFSYCSNLTEWWFNDWRVPSTDELIRHVDTLENNSHYLFTYTPADSSYFNIYRKDVNTFIKVIYNHSSFYVYCVR